MSNPTQVLAQFACRLKNLGPKEWDEFVECFDCYATEVTVAVTRAEQNEVLVAQGRARAFLHLLDLFRHCNQRAQSPQTPQP